MREEMKPRDKEDKLLLRQRLKEKRTQEKMKIKRSRSEGEEVLSGSEAEAGDASRNIKRSKIYFDSDRGESDDEGNEKEVKLNTASISLAEQEDLALKLLNSMHS